MFNNVSIICFKRNSITARWVGFQDPQSGLEYFEWCLGTIKGTCDLLAMENVQLSTSILKAGLGLPLIIEMFVTVRATNRNGMSVLRSSEAFRIDMSPPVLLTKPIFVLDQMVLSEKVNTQWENSIIRLEWMFSDNESSVTEHSVTLNVNDNGRTVREEMTCGSEHKMIIRLNNDELLRDGDVYTAHITACNNAGLCSTATTDPLLIDSTAPHLGGFTRNMKWFTTKRNGLAVTALTVEWFGFQDLESGIDVFKLAASCSYSGSELTNGTIQIPNTNSNRNSSTIYLPAHIGCRSDLILSILAINGVGLRSKTARVTVEFVSRNVQNTYGFMLELTRHSCVSHYCNNDCTCSVVGLKCEHSTNVTCIEKQPLNDTNSVDVFFGDADYYRGLNMTISTKCLRINWKRKHIGNQSLIQRYEWSISEYGGNPGEGIFNIPYEPVWYDNGKATDVVHCITDSIRTLKDETAYVAYVRAWYAYDLYETFTSNTIVIEHTPPQVVRGRYVFESTYSCTKDLEYTTESDITICWNGVFRDTGSGIIHYELMGGTKPYGKRFQYLKIIVFICD